jgi:hypothetical protein
MQGLVGFIIEEAIFFDGLVQGFTIQEVAVKNYRKSAPFQLDIFNLNYLAGFNIGHETHFMIIPGTAVIKTTRYQFLKRNGVKIGCISIFSNAACTGTCIYTGDQAK